MRIPQISNKIINGLLVTICIGKSHLDTSRTWRQPTAFPSLQLNKSSIYEHMCYSRILFVRLLKPFVSETFFTICSMKNLCRTIRPTPCCWLADCAEPEKHINDLGLFHNILVKDKRLFGNQAPQVT